MLDAEDALTHQNGLLLIAKSLQIPTGTLFQQYDDRLATNVALLYWYVPQGGLP